MKATLLPLLAAMTALLFSPAFALPAGERHLTASDASAALRDAAHRPTLRVTVWYPAAKDARQERIVLGPKDKPFFIGGESAANAPFADGAPKPVILFSHGFGGTARMMGWFTIALAQAGYIVIAPDHPGNNGQDKMTVAGEALTWDRVQDLSAALDAAKADPVIGPHLDLKRVGVAGFSLGGFTALVAAGARVAMNRIFAFCHSHPGDGECVPQKEFKATMDDLRRALRSPALRKEAARAGEDHAIPAVRAAFVMAPALVPALTQESLERMKLPVSILLGGADPVATPANNGLVAAEFIPHAQLEVLPRVGHYDFLATCTQAGKATPYCTARVPQDQTHRRAIQMALAFFGEALKPRKVK